jgi:hypothetical protein
LPLNSRAAPPNALRQARRTPEQLIDSKAQSGVAWTQWLDERHPSIILLRLMRAVPTRLCAEVNLTLSVGDDLIANRAAQVFRVRFTVPRILFSLDLIFFGSHTSPSQ